MFLLFFFFLVSVIYNHLANLYAGSGIWELRDDPDVAAVGLVRTQAQEVVSPGQVTNTANACLCM